MELEKQTQRSLKLAGSECRIDSADRLKMQIFEPFYFYLSIKQSYAISETEETKEKLLRHIPSEQKGYVGQSNRPYGFR